MLTLAIIINIIFFFAWIYILAYNDLVSEDYLEQAIRQIIRGIIWGSIVGLIVAFFELLPKYVRKEWDLHIVVPYFLMIHLSLAIIINIGQFYVAGYDGLSKIGFGLGFIIGGLIGIIAYIGEVKIEHSDSAKTDEVLLVEDED